MDSDKLSLFFKLLRLGLGTEKAGGSDSIGFSSLNNSEWEELLALGAEQGVAAIQADGLQKLIISKEAIPPQKVRMLWANHTIQVEKRWNKHREVIGKLAGFYGSHDIKMMVLKGYGLSLLYPTPQHRPCGDIDIWLYGELERGDKLLHTERGIEIDKDHHHHTVFHIDGVTIENHYDFLNIHAHLSNREIEHELKSLAMQSGEKTDVHDSKIFLPHTDFNALFLLRHAGAHFAAAEIALRHIADWAMFVLHFHKDIDWERLEKTAKRQNMHRFLHCINGICIDLLNIPPEIFPPFERDKALEERMMSDILCPAFPDKSALKSNLLNNFLFRLRRWWANRWKHRMVYREGLLLTFLVQIRNHLMKAGEWK